MQFVSQATQRACKLVTAELFVFTKRSISCWSSQPSSRNLLRSPDFNDVAPNGLEVLVLSQLFKTGPLTLKGCHCPGKSAHKQLKAVATGTMNCSLARKAKISNVSSTSCLFSISIAVNVLFFFLNQHQHQLVYKGDTLFAGCQFSKKKIPSAIALYLAIAGCSPLVLGP